MKKIPQYELRLVRNKLFTVRSCRSIKSAADILHQMLDESPVEQAVVLYVDSSANMVACEKIAIGSIETVNVHAREIFRGAIHACVPRIILGHNHPAGDPTPSMEDILLTSEIADIGDILGIKVEDHIVVSPNKKFFSIFDENNAATIKKIVLQHLKKTGASKKQIKKIQNVRLTK